MRPSSSDGVALLDELGVALVDARAAEVVDVEALDDLVLAVLGGAREARDEALGRAVAAVADDAHRHPVALGRAEHPRRGRGRRRRWPPTPPTTGPRALMMAAPRCWTVGMNSPSSQAWSLADGVEAGLARRPRRGRRRGTAWPSGCPRSSSCVTSVLCAPALAASWAMARLWSRRVMAVKRRGIEVLGVAAGR